MTPRSADFCASAEQPQHPEPSPTAIRLRLPATSANLGPGFDALGLALSLWLVLEAREALTFSVQATGRDARVTGALEDNLILTTYREVLEMAGRLAPPLAIELQNGIPLGMGCGSSAAALCAGVLLANHFGRLRWTPDQVLNEAARREGHPDNVAACLRGGLTASKGDEPDTAGAVLQSTIAVTLGLDLDWRLLLALPSTALSTATARQLLPATYSRSDAVLNVQSTALLVSAFALDRPDLLAAGTADRLHQPYRREVCPLLPALLPLVGKHGVYSVTLSGAGPAVLLVVDGSCPAAIVRESAGALVDEVLEVAIARGASVEEIG